MATKYNGLFDYAANYNVKLAQPLDTRGVCDSVAALIAKDTFGTGGAFAYDGMVVTVPNAGVYYLKNAKTLQNTVNVAEYVDPTSATDEELLAAGWQKLGDQAASNVNSVNGKSGNVTLTAGDIGITAIDGVEGENIQAALEAINTKASTAYKYKGSKDTYEELPAEGNQVGDVWNVVAAHGTTPAGTNYAWTGTEWDALGGLVDLSTYQTKAITIDGATTTVEAAIAANKTSAANNATAIDKNKTDISTISGAVGSLDTLVKSKQDATVDVSVNGTSYTTIPEAINALDSYVGDVKAVSDGAAKVDASNITDTGAWKTKLGYALESSLNTVATNVETVSGDLKALSTKVDTVSGDLDALEVSVATKASNTDLQTVSAQVDVNTAAIKTANAAIETKATQADMTALSGKVGNNTSAISTINATLTGKADKATTLAGYGITDAYTKAEVDNAIDQDVADATETILLEVDKKVNKSDIATTIAASTAASDTKVPSEKAVATAIESVKEVASKAYKYKGSDTYANISAIQDAEVGDVWNSTTANGVYPKGTNYAWNGTEWDALGGEVDLSAYQKSSDDTLETTAKTVVGAINEVKGVADAAAKADASNITVATWKTKLGFITAEEVPAQVQPDWNAASGKGQILNKPNIIPGSNIHFCTIIAEIDETPTNVTNLAVLQGRELCYVTESTDNPEPIIQISAGTGATIANIIVEGSNGNVYNISGFNSTTESVTIIKDLTVSDPLTIDYDSGVVAITGLNTGNVAYKIKVYNGGV